VKLKFKDIKPGIYPAKITDIIEEYGPYGIFLRFHFTVTRGDLKDWLFYGIVKPNAFKQAKFYRWLTIILGKEPPSDDIDIFQIIGKECYIALQKKTKGEKVYYSVTELVKENTTQQA
jgi:hypothetical protein